MSQEQPEYRIVISAAVSMNTIQPSVRFELSGNVAVVNCEEARDMAKSLMECAAIAEADAFLASYAKEKIGLNEDSLRILLESFRDFKNKEL